MIQLEELKLVVFFIMQLNSVLILRTRRTFRILKTDHASHWFPLDDTCPAEIFTFDIFLSIKTGEYD